ncbi:hypothetical protein AB205_0090140 [Aquarana catesbeiana]|uniref:Uncharacterized protein n=1 Tax=Aquarana catesbeiana TaxID=8400 RepID=A0A2G9R5J5_AQUCT|nr:hypothetical protein AB205_0090140 [Aquarana catesbeiana]
MIVVDEAKTTAMSLFHTQGSLSQEVAGPSRLPDIQVPTLHLQRQSGRKRSTLEEAAIDLFWKATEALRTPHTVEEDFTCITACKMLQMEEGQRLLCPNTTPPPPPPPGPTPPPATSPIPEPQPGRKRGKKTRK